MEFNVELLKENDHDILRFHLGNNHDIDLNSEKQDGIKALFYELISLSFDNEISFSFNSDNHDHDLFYDISVDYLRKLEDELKTIRAQIPEKLTDNPIVQPDQQEDW